MYSDKENDDRVDEILEKVKAFRNNDEYKIDVSKQYSLTNSSSLITFLYKKFEKYTDDSTGKKLNYIVIVDFEVDKDTQKIVNIMNAKYEVFVQIFEKKTLYYDVTEHFLVPKHTRIAKRNPEKIQKIYDEYFINNPSKLPKILVSDPVAKFIGLEIGDLVEIDRVETKMIRVCV